MSELFWPGDSRAGALLSDEALIAAMTRVEVAWLRALRSTGVAPPDVDDDLAAPARLEDVEAGGNPVIPLVAALRASTPEPTRTWLHRGLTSQDVLDTALVLCLRDAIEQVQQDGLRQIAALRELADAHRTTVQAGRTLTQHAVPTTFGLTAARWLDAIVDGLTDLRAVSFPVQAGGAAGTLAALVELTGSRDTALAVVAAFATELQLEPAMPWHTSRRPITRIGDALLACVDAWGPIAHDVALRSRPEFGELAEPSPGGSSTMPHKQNPVLSVLINRAALVAPFTAAQLHATAAAAVDERPDGAWHAEWAALRTLGRLTVVAGSQTADLLQGLVVRADRMAEIARAASDDLLAEQRSMGGAGDDLATYLGLTEHLIDAAIGRADAFVKGSPS